MSLNLVAAFELNNIIKVDVCDGKKTRYPCCAFRALCATLDI
jgi:hypothetical protein